MQAACPPALFAALRKHLGVNGELFASPLNTTFTSFCSAAPDVDAPFGSAGSFFGCNVLRGAYFANPPFAHDVVTAMGARMGSLLDRSERKKEALTFVIVIPYWKDEACWQMLARHKYVSRVLLFKQEEHGYLAGGEYYRAAGSVWQPSNHDSSLFLLQTGLAATNTPLTPLVERALRDAFRTVPSGPSR